jgi:uncharacterized membrane protein
MSPLSNDNHNSNDARHGDSLATKWRKNVLTGLVLVAPLYLTFWLLSSFVQLIDNKVGQFLPAELNPQTYFHIPGYGLVLLVVFAALLGALAKNFIMAKIIGWGESALDRLPVVRSIYNSIKQIAHTVLVQSDRSFEKACLVEYPRKGIWALAFISTATRGEVRERTGAGAMMSIFLPTTPNPTSGFLLFVPKEDVIELDMTLEEAAKLVISAGLISPPSRAELEAARGPQATVPAAAE